ncbi:MAG: hypothetical protein Kow0031_23460 [Anaerolineae bacterium]
MTKSKWQALLESALETKEYEISCQECHDVIDMYVDLLLEQANPADVMPAVEQHIKQCNCCAGELEAILIMLDEAIPKEDTAA